MGSKTGGTNRRVSWVEIWEDPRKLPREYPISTRNSKPKH